MQCSALHADSDGDATTDVMQCVSDSYQSSQDSREENLRSFLLVVCGGMIFFMQSGFAMMCAGSVRLKNVQNTMLKNLLDACGAALAFYLIGTFALNNASQQDIEKQTKICIESNESCRIPISALGSTRRPQIIANNLFLSNSFYPIHNRLRLCLWWRPFRSRFVFF